MQLYGSKNMGAKHHDSAVQVNYCALCSNASPYLLGGKKSEISFQGLNSNVSHELFFF